MFDLRILVMITISCVITESAVQMATHFNSSVKWKISISCKSENPLVSCNFKTWFQNTSNSENYTETIDRSCESVAKDLETNSGSDSLCKDNKTCNISLQLEKDGQYLVGCRTREENSNWEYSFTTFHVHGSGDIQSGNITEEHVPQGGNFTIDWKVPNNSQFSECTFLYLGNSASTASTLSEDACPKNSDTGGIFCHSGIGCNLTLLNVDRSTIGGPVFRIGRVNNSINYFAAKLIIIDDIPQMHQMAIAMYRDNISFSPTNQSRLKEGDTLTAKCLSTTATNITWLLGGQIIRRNVNYVNDEWTWPWELRNIAQILTHTITSNDFGKNLTCKVTHQYKNKEEIFEAFHKIEGPLASSEVRVATKAAAYSVLFLAVLIAASCAVRYFLIRQTAALSFVPKVLPPETMPINLDNELYFSTEPIRDNNHSARPPMDIPLVEFTNDRGNKGNEHLYTGNINSSFESEKPVAESEYNFYDEPMVENCDQAGASFSKRDTRVYQEVWTAKNQANNRETVIYDEIINSPDTIPPLPETKHSEAF